MWGNSLGWGISSVIVIVTVGALVWVSRTLNTISGPTDFSAQSGAVDPISVPTIPTAVLPDGAEGVDTDALYHQAIDLYEQNRTVFNEFAQRPNPNDLPTVKPGEAVTYDANSPLAALKAVGDCAAGAGLIAKVNSDKGTALADLQAAFSLGQRMADERLCYAELSGGLGLMGGSAIELAEMAKANGDQAKADALNTFAANISDYTTKKLVPIETVLSSIDQATIEQNAGDLFWLAKNSKERMWRIEAIHALGRVHYNAGRPGDNRGAPRVCGEIAQTDPDPIIKLAATQARDLTIEQYNALH
jgi:hypothetical protein